jgi:hypothetical protein
MQQLIENLAVDLRKNFREMHRQLVNLDKRLHAIEHARIHGDAAITGVQARLDREATIDDLAAETKRVMIAAGKSYLKRKMDEPQSSSAPEIILAVSDSLLSASPPQPQPPLSPLFPPLDGPPVIRAAAHQVTDNHHRKPTPGTPPTMTSPAPQHQLPAVQQALDDNQREPMLRTPPMATPPAARHRPPSSRLPASPATAQQTQAPTTHGRFLCP